MHTSYILILVFIVSILLFHDRLLSLPKDVAAVAILMPNSLSSDVVEVMVDPR